MNVFPRVVWVLPQTTAFVLKIQQENLHGRKSTEWKSALTTQYLLSRKSFSCGFLAGGGFHLSWVINICLH